VVAEVLKPGTYKLADQKGAVFTNAWNIEQLRRFSPRAVKLYVLMYILYQDPMNEYVNKRKFFQVVYAITGQISKLGGSPNYDPS